jgi:hypothetical protein
MARFLLGHLLKSEAPWLLTKKKSTGLQFVRVYQRHLREAGQLTGLLSVCTCFMRLVVYHWQRSKQLNFVDQDEKCSQLSVE